MGGFYCSQCKCLNLCNCESCKKVYGSDIGDLKFVGWTADGEELVCQYCGVIFSLDESLEVEIELLKHSKT